MASTATGNIDPQFGGAWIQAAFQRADYGHSDARRIQSIPINPERLKPAGIADPREECTISVAVDHVLHGDGA